MTIPKEYYDDRVQARDIEGLITNREYGLRADDDPEIDSAAHALARIGSAAIQPLLEALDEFALDARIAVAQQRKGTGVFASMEALQNPLTFHAVDSEIQRRLDGSAPPPCYPPALALVRIGKPSVLPLVQYLQQEKDWLGREAAVWALGEIGNRGVVPALKRVVRFLRRDRVSRAAREAIRKIERRGST